MAANFPRIPLAGAQWGAHLLSSKVLGGKNRGGELFLRLRGVFFHRCALSLIAINPGSLGHKEVLTIMPALQFATGVQPVLSQSACSSPLFDESAGGSAASRSGSAALLPERFCLVQTLLQHLNKIDYISGRRRGRRLRSDLFVLRFLFDDLH